MNGSVIAMTTKGKSFRKRQWWQTGDDELAAYDRKVEVWISSRHKIQQNQLDDLKALLNCVWNSLVFSYLASMSGVVCAVCPFADDEKLKNIHVNLALLV